MLPFNKKLKPFARNLRSSMTDAELLIWSKIRRKQIGDLQFYRQKNIGNYIVDFYCPKGKLIVEIDGGQHYESAGLKKDQERDRCLQQLGFAVLRFSDIEVLKNINGVVERIYEHLKSPLPPLSPFRAREKRGEIMEESTFKNGGIPRKPLLKKVGIKEEWIQFFTSPFIKGIEGDFGNYIKILPNPPFTLIT